MDKKYLALFLLVFFSGLCYIIPVNARQGTYSLSPKTYIKDSHFMSSIDTYKWSFTSSISQIMVLGLSQSQYDKFYNQYFSEYTVRLNKYSSFTDSGSWHPPNIDTWHILYCNIGSTTTTITINSSGIFITMPLIIVGILGIIIIVIGIIARKQHVKKKQAKQIQEVITLQESPETTPEKHEVNTITTVSKIPTSTKFCPECGSKLAKINQKFCMDCGTTI